MAAPTLNIKRRILDELHRGLNQALTDLQPDQYGSTLYLKRVDEGPQPSQTRFSIEGPEGLQVVARCSVPRIGGTTHDLRVEIEGGPTQQFRHTPSTSTTEVDQSVQLGHTVAAFLLDEMERRLGRALFQNNSSMGAGLQVPMLSLDQEGTIQDVTDAAKRVLEYSSDARLDSCFFSHVHGDNLRRVMRDLARMVCRCKQYSQWLLRLRTGNSRWRWYRAKVRNHLNREKGLIQVRLHPL